MAKACLFRHQFFAPPTRSDSLAFKKSAVELLKLLHLKSTCFTLLNKVIKFHHEILQTLAAQTHPEILRFDTDTNAVVTISG